MSYVPGCVAKSLATGHRYRLLRVIVKAVLNGVSITKDGWRNEPDALKRMFKKCVNCSNVNVLLKRCVGLRVFVLGAFVRCMFLLFATPGRPCEVYIAQMVVEIETLRNG